jgi:hypothetical protein
MSVKHIEDMGTSNAFNVLLGTWDWVPMDLIHGHYVILNTQFG